MANTKGGFKGSWPCFSYNNKHTFLGFRYDVLPDMFFEKNRGLSDIYDLFVKQLHCFTCFFFLFNF